MLNVMRTGCGSPPNWSLHYLKKIDGVRVIAGDANPISVSFFSVADEYVVIPYADDPHFAEKMLEICQNKKVDILIPAVDEELVKLAKVKDLFISQGVFLLLSEPETLEKCFDKWEFYLEMKSLGVPVPATFQNKEDLTNDFPLILKPRRGRGSSGIFILDDVNDLDYAIKKSKNYILQEYIEGTEYTVDTLSDLQGRFIYGSPRIRLKTDSGISVTGKTKHDPIAIQWIEKILNQLKIIGPANVQYIKSRGKIYFLEINPRLAGGGALAQGAGIPYMQDIINLVRGDNIPVRQAKEGVVMLRYWSEVFIDEPDLK
ncbi:MAG: hypothetical protein AMJ53_06635 [Gammaproteobacteria bacterium SG8_11]|nr:MAG: hypothetical protein AMJ53_06635 [Gammaproteobacteria bacterium SG8_11]